MRRHLLVLLSVASFALASCNAASASPSAASGSPSAASGSPSPTQVPGRSLNGKPLTACTEGSVASLCGTFQVRENPSDSASRLIDLKVVVIPATGGRSKPDPMFALEGGPGGSASEGFTWLPAVYSLLNVNRDIVLVDQRGTGGSNPIKLSDKPGPEIAYYTTEVAMDDLDQVRAALGYDKIDLYGPSYGATAAQYYMRQHADHVRAAVLDGATLVDVPIKEHWAANSQRSLDLLFAQCDADPACHAAFPDLRAEFKTLWDRAKTAPIDTGIKNPDTGHNFMMDLIPLEQGIHSALVGSDTRAVLPLLIHEAFLGRWDSVMKASQQTGGGQSSNGELAMAAVIWCSEAWARHDPNEIARLSAGSYDLEDQVAWAAAEQTYCAPIPHGVVPANDAEPVRSDIPVLLTVGEADPQDPPPNIADAPSELPNSLTIVVAGQGHTVSHLGCMPAIVTAFIDAGTVNGLDTSCVRNGGVPMQPFVLQ